MHAALDWQDDSSPPLPATSSPRTTTPGALPPAVASALWRGTELGQQVTSTVPSGWQALDAELPGGGWPCRSLTEILCPQPALVEWRLLGRALRQVITAGAQIVVVGPPKHPHLAGLRHEGIDERQLIWIQAATPAERLWTTEQLIKSNAAGALLSWLPQARPEQLRRLQVCAQHCDGPVFLLRPDTAAFEASPAPLRVQASFGLDWELRVHLLKRRGAVHDGELVLPSIPGGLEAVLTPRLRKPSRLMTQVSREVAADVVGSPASSPRPRRHAAAH